MEEMQGEGGRGIEGVREREREREREKERERWKSIQTADNLSQLTGKDMSADSACRSTLTILRALSTLVTSGAIILYICMYAHGKNT